LLRVAEAGRAIFVTCAPARDPKPFWGAYAASKAALEALVMTYAAETKRSRLRVNLVDPGPLRSRLRKQAYPGEAPEKVPLSETRTDAFVALADPECQRHGELISS
jgi:NAD(P)-dependent dehydrogenase (short-subunit alcohol dehydrogenase family)